MVGGASLAWNGAEGWGWESRAFAVGLPCGITGCAAGLKAAACMGISAIMLEVDAVQVKIALEGDEYRLSSPGGVIMEIKL
jgi:hypothetical protein